jgi:putative transcriptional regulator
LTKGLHEIVDDMRRAGITDEITHAKITLRHPGGKANGVTEPITINDIWSGAKRPTGPALVLLNVIRRKGIEAILRRRSVRVSNSQG